MKDDLGLFFWYWSCGRGCSIRTVAPTATLPDDWTTWRCPYDGTPLAAVTPREFAG